MSKYIAFGLIAAGAAGLYFAYAFSNKVVIKQEDSRQSENIPSAWIEVVKPLASKVDESGKAIVEYKTGDEIGSGSMIAISEGGESAIHFADGSVLRLDAGTRVTIDEALFDFGNDKLTVKATLAVGRVWSKVIALVSPESSWQVKTSSAVATVRGTAFGVEYLNGKMKVLAAERSITVAVIDPKTGVVDEKSAVVVNEASFMEIEDKEVAAIIAEPKAFAGYVRSVPKAELENAWVKANIGKDRKIDQAIEEIKKSEGSEEKVREKIRESVELEFEKTSAEPLKTESIDSRPEADAVLEQKVIDTARQQETAVSAPVPAAKPVSLSITYRANIKEIVEGTNVSFQAILAMSDGTKRDVTKEAVWSVAGNIGAMETPGVLFAVFGEAESELESVSGTVTASWSKDGVSFKAEPVGINLIHTTDDTIPIG